MKKSIFAVCDLEASYAVGLTEYMNERRHAPFEVRAFTNTESLKAFAENNHIEVLLISTGAMSDAVRSVDAERIIILSEGEQVEDWGQELSVCKYQSSENLVAEVMDYYARSAGVHPTFSGRITGVGMTGIYSPLGRTGQTLFALTLGEMLGRHRKVLYINLEDCNGFEALMGTSFSSDLSDLVYFARQKEGSLIYKLTGMIMSAGHLDYIPPAFSPSDLRDVHADEWLQFLSDIAADSDYEEILLDIGTQIEEYPLLLRQCRRVYYPVLSDRVSLAKFSQFESAMNAMDYRDVMEKAEKLRLPRTQVQGTGPDMIKHLAAGPMGSFVTRLMGRDEDWKKLREESGRAV